MTTDLSDEQSKLFGLSLKKWQIRLNLADWRVVFGQKWARRGVMAEAHITLRDRLAEIRVGKSGLAGATDHEIEATAVHEMLHVMLFELVTLARDPNTSDENLASLEHAVITVLEPLIFPMTPTLKKESRCQPR